MLAPVAPQTIWGWLYNSLGPTFSILIPLAGVVSLVLVVFLLWKGRGPMSAAAICLAIAGPLLVGMIAMLHGIIEFHLILATAVGAPRPAEYAEGYAMAYTAPWVALLASVPAYLVAVVGTAVRSFTSRD